MTKECLMCTKEFKRPINCSRRTWETQKKYCSNQCRRLSQVKIVLINCLYCNQEFKVTPYKSKAGRRKYCSIICRNLSYTTKLKINCLFCNKKFKTIPYIIKLGWGKYCSRKCATNVAKGKPTWNKGLVGFMLGRKVSKETRQKQSQKTKRENNPMWKGGLTSLRRSIRKLFQYTEWRNFYFQRDNYTCKECGARSEKNKVVILHVDHYPKSFAQICDENNIQNLEQAIDCKELWSLDNGRTLCLACHKKTDTYLKDYRKLKKELLDDS